MTRVDDVIEFTQTNNKLVSLLINELHPIVNLLGRYDVLNSRLTRFMTYLLQISIYSLSIVLVFG